jgi:hypothetical protein
VGRTRHRSGFVPPLHEFVNLPEIMTDILVPNLELAPLASAQPRLGLAIRVWYSPQMERVVQVFSSLADADCSDEEYYANLSPSERVDILLDLIEQHRSSLGAAADRFERVCRIAQLSQC